MALGDAIHEDQNQNGRLDPIHSGVPSHHIMMIFLRLPVITQFSDLPVNFCGIGNHRSGFTIISGYVFHIGLFITILLYAPHILVFSSGDMTPFELHVFRRDLDQSITLESNLLGEIKFVDPEQL